MNWNNFEFENQEFLWGLLVLPLLIFWYFYTNNKNSARLTISSTQGFQLEKSVLTYLKPLLAVLRIVAVVALLVALARPRNVSVSKRTKTKQRNRYCNGNGCFRKYVGKRFTTKQIRSIKKSCS